MTSEATGTSLLAEIQAHVRDTPDKRALVLPRSADPNSGERATYAQLSERVERFAGGLQRAGFERGDRVIVAAPPSLDFFAVALALLGSGMPLVLIDGSMGRRRLLDALRSSRARAIVSQADALRRWPLIPPLVRMRRYAVDGRARGVRPLAALDGPRREGTLGAASAGDAAIVSFTSGSTGRSKGVERDHGILLGQHRALARHLPFEPGDVDMPCFPAVVMHNLCCGVTTVLPPVDLRHPASVDPAKACDVARREGVTTMSAAPAFIDRIVRHMLERSVRLDRVRRVIVGGAPVPRSLCARIVRAFPDADAIVAYGSTEAEPISHVGMRELLATPGEGLLVGTPVPEVDLVLARDLPPRLEEEIGDGDLAAYAADLGEVVVSGASVSRSYVGDREALLANKVREAGGRVWHRTGDVARRDEEGRLWLLGRTGDLVRHRGTLLYPFPLEDALAGLPGVRAAALVAHAGAPEGEVAVVPDAGPVPPAVEDHLRERGLGSLPVRVLDSIPVDARHNSKVDRPALARRLAARGEVRSAP